MTEKQKRFCDEYLIDLNATKSAIRAGYSSKTAYSIGDENLKKPEIKAYIEEKLEEIKSQNIADAKEVLEYLSRTMRCDNIQDRDRLKAAELLGKRYSLFRENVNITGAVPVVIVDDMCDE